MNGFLRAVPAGILPDTPLRSISKDDAELNSNHPVLTVFPLQTGLWRVKESGGEKLLDLYHKGAAVYFATNWARSHALAEVLVYTEEGELEEIVRVSAQAVAWQS